MRYEQARIDYTPIQKTSSTEKHVCRTCEHEKYGYTCSHSKVGKKGWLDMPQSKCWEIKTFGKKKKREDSIESA